MSIPGLYVPTGARVPLVMLPTTPDLKLADGRRLRLVRAWKAPLGDLVIPAQDWEGPQGLHIMASLDPTDAWGELLHVSTSYRDVNHRPTWEDLQAIKDAFFGDVDACMILPKREDYVNIRDNCFHLWQIPQRWGIR